MQTVCKSIKKLWLRWIIEGSKIYDGRVKRDFWASLRSGDIFCARSETDEVNLRVTEIFEFIDFGEMYRVLGEELVPDVEIAWNDTYPGIPMPNEDTREIIRKIYSVWYSDNEIKKYGVIAIGVVVL